MTTSPPAPSAGLPPGPPAAPTGWVRRLWGVMLRHRRDLVLAFTAAGLASVTQTLVPLIAREIVDGVILTHTSALWPWLVLLVVLSAAGFAFAYLRRYRGGRMALAVQYDLRNAMHDHLQVMDFDNLESHADRSAGRPGQLRLDPRPGTAQLLPDHERQRAPAAALAGRHDLPVAAARGGQPGRRAQPAGRLLPHAAPGLPGHLGRPAARGRRRPDRRRGRERRPGGQGLRPGGPRAASGWPTRHRSSTAPRCGPSDSSPATSRSSRPSRRSARWPSWPSAAGWPCTTRSPWARSWPSRPTWPCSWLRPASWPACSPSASRPAPAWSGSSSCSTCDRPSSIPPDAVDLPTLRGEISFRNVHFNYAEDRPVLRGIDLRHRTG